MALKIDSFCKLKQYLNGVNQRAGHHAKDVDKISDYLVGFLIRVKDDDKDIEVMEKDGETKNVLWVYIKGKRYAFSYNHDSRKIETREYSIKGEVIGEFDNYTSLSSVKEFFDNL